MTTKDEVREEIKTRLMYACPNIDLTYAINSMEDLFDSLLAKKREETGKYLDDYAKGLVSVPFPDLTLKRIKEEILSILTN